MDVDVDVERCRGLRGAAEEWMGRVEGSADRGG